MEVETRFKQPRVRSRTHLDWIRTLRCCIPDCKGQPTIAHHLTCSPEPKARGLKAGDDWAVNLCEPIHHSAQSDRGVHYGGDERAWWAAHEIDPIFYARRLASLSRAAGRLP